MWWQFDDKLFPLKLHYEMDLMYHWIVFWCGVTEMRERERERAGEAEKSNRQKQKKERRMFSCHLSSISTLHQYRKYLFVKGRADRWEWSAAITSEAPGSQRKERECGFTAFKRHLHFLIYLKGFWSPKRIHMLLNGSSWYSVLHLVQNWPVSAHKTKISTVITCMSDRESPTGFISLDTELRQQSIKKSHLNELRVNSLKLT